MRSKPDQMWKWLSRDKTSSVLTAIRSPINGHPETGEAMINHVREFWRGIWPQLSRELQQPVLDELAQQAPWPDSEEPTLPPLSSAQLKNRVRKQQHKAAGPDGWKPSDAPDATFEAMAQELNDIEKGGDWPEALLQWNQTHAQKPKKEMGVSDSMEQHSCAPAT